MLQRASLSLVGRISRSSRLCIAVKVELGGESPVSLLPSSLASMGYLDVVWEKLEERCIWTLLLLEICDVFV